MTPEEFALEMSEIKENYNYDQENCHFMMDCTMCDLLRELGYEDGVDIFASTEKWYA